MGASLFWLSLVARRVQVAMVPQPAGRGSGQVRKIRRLLNIVERLQGGRPHSAAELADFCGCSIRTIFRDIKLLGDVGLSIMNDDHRQGYWIPVDHRLPAQNLTPQEVAGMVLACDELGRRIPFLHPAREAALKLMSNLSESSRNEFKDFGDTIQIHLGPMMKRDDLEGLFGVILSCLQSRQKIRLYYDSASENANFSTLVSTYSVFFGTRAWYVIGRSSVHRAVRTFNLCRIRQVERTSDTYEIPARFSITRYFGNAWKMIRESGKDTRVVVRFSAPVATNVEQVLWHRTQKTRWNLDGTLQFEVTVSGIREIAWWILGYGEFAEVIEPQELCDLIEAHAEGMARIYRRKTARSIHSN